MIHKGAFICLFYLIQLRHSVVSDFCDPMDCSTPGFPVHHQLPELAQIHVHQISDAIQPSHPLSSPSPPAFNLSQHQGLPISCIKISLLCDNPALGVLFWKWCFFVFVFFQYGQDEYYLNLKVLVHFWWTIHYLFLLSSWFLQSLRRNQL